MSLTTLTLAGGFMAALGTLLAALLALASRRLYVYEDPRIEAVEDMLPHANCGACGTAGCRQFAEAAVRGLIDPGKCTVAPRADLQDIADLLEVEVGQHEKRVARLACAGGQHVAHMRAHYAGLPSCRAAALVAGGGKGCSWGCLGFGDCAAVCEFEALAMSGCGLPVLDESRCTACGDCVEVCPKDLLSLQPVGHRLWVACRNLDPGDEAETQCEVVCNACGRCVADAPEGLITVQDHLARIDYSKNELASRLPIERCPTGAIVWLDADQGVVKGIHAKKIIRRKALPVASGVRAGGGQKAC